MKSTRGPFEKAYPTIARWLKDFGYIEMGYDDCNRSFVRALDIGGLIWEGRAKYPSVDAAMEDLERGLKKALKEIYGK